MAEGTGDGGGHEEILTGFADSFASVATRTIPHPSVQKYRMIQTDPDLADESRDPASTGAIETVIGSDPGMEHCVNMKDRSIYAWMLVAAWLFCWVEPIPCAAQPPVLPSPVQPPTASRPSMPGRPGAGTCPGLAPHAPPTARPGRGSAATAPSPLATSPRLKPAPFEPTDVRFPINLATALRLSDARPLIVAAAQARVWVAEAELTQAKVLWLPDLNIGFDYIRHDGGGPDFNKGILTAPSTNFFYAGAGLWGNHLGIIYTTDAIYQPLVARQVLNARHWDIQTAKNDALLQTADAYFMVHQYRGIYAGALYTVERGATWSSGSPP